MCEKIILIKVINEIQVITLNGDSLFPKKEINININTVIE
jgi:hypothetical protein